MAIKAIFLDFYGTVVEEDDKYITQICSIVANNSKMEVTSKDVGYFWWKEFLSMYTNSYGDDFQTQRTLQVVSLQKTISHFNSSGDAEELCSILFSYAQNPLIFEDSIMFFEKVALPIIILSNIDRQDILPAVERHKVKVKEVLTSEDSKSYKPRSEMFIHALEKVGLLPEEVIHIGDSWSCDVIGAKNAGIKSIWINRMNKTAGKDVEPFATCNSLLSVLEHIS